jgi:hypothetical protein
VELQGIDFLFLWHGVTICGLLVSRRCCPRGRCVAVLEPLALLPPVPRALITFHSWTFPSTAMISPSETVLEGSTLSHILTVLQNECVLWDRN